MTDPQTAALQALLTRVEAGGNAHCEYCDGTGDVHRPDGEWLGVCDCPAGVALRALIATPADTEGR